MMAIAILLLIVCGVSILYFVIGFAEHITRMPADELARRARRRR